MEEFIHDKYTLKAMEQVRLGRSFFITGKAGTGKTTLLKKIVSESRARGKNIAVSAPTGVAAKNAEGQTLHSLFGLKTIVFIPGKIRRWFRRMDDARVKVIKNIEILIIDEISMVRCDVLDMVDLTLQYYKDNKKPFGGIQVILFGDLFQLPPVVTDEDRELLYSHYKENNPYFFSADVISKHPFPVLELEKVYRQPDENFVKILNHIRNGEYLESERNEINKRLKVGYEPSGKESGVFLRTKKKDVRKHNNRKLNELPSKEEPPFWAEKDPQFPKHLYPTDNPLKLKVGAKVMLLRNDNDGLKFVNGTQGVITSIYDGSIRVLTDEGEPITIEQSTWELYKYVWDEDTKSIIPIVYASFTQYPIKLAWAVTIHKSQGMTFSKVIVDAHNSFAAGQVYVALSRCRSLEGLILTSRITKSDIMVDPIVVEYMKTVKRIIPSETEQDSETIEQKTFFFSDDGKTITGIASEISGNIEIPYGVEKIAKNAFKDNTNITSVVFPSSLREIGNHAFWNCINLKEINLNEGLESIGLESFIHTGLESVDLPSTLNFLNWTPFECKMNVHHMSEYFCSDINGVLYSTDETSLILYPRRVHEESIRVPESVTRIESYAFENCIAKELNIPEGIEELQGNLFKGCQMLKTITICSVFPKELKIDDEAFKGFEVEKCVLRVPFDALSEYKKDERFKDFKYITAIEGSRCLLYDEKGTEILGCDDEDCEDIDIPEGVTSIKDKAFEDNEQLESVHFPDSLLTIGCCAFSGCTHVTDIRLNEGLISIDWDAFRGTSLSRVYIPYSVEEIGYSAFKCEMEVESINTDYCTIDGILYSFDEKKLVIYPTNKETKEFSVPDTVETICSFAFEDTSLKSLTLPDSIKTIGRSIFGSESVITKLTIDVDDPDKLNIDENVFEGFYKNLCKLVVPHGCSAKYFSHKHFKGFLSISEMQDGSPFLTIPKSGYVTGQYFEKLKETVRSESKLFCRYNGHDYCYVVMTSKGFFLKIMGGGYFFLSEHISEYTFGNIWVQNKKGSLSSYNVSYTTDGKTPKAFGRFFEGLYERTLTYRDLKSGNSFMLDLKTGKKRE
jgi:hypothetical protein